MTKNLLLIFTRNPEFGRVKTRLATTVGPKAALEIYKFLLTHTHKVTAPVKAEKHVYYSENISEDDLWKPPTYKKKLQKGPHLGARMQHAFKQGFKEGFSNIIVIGSDMYHISSEEIDQAFKTLEAHDFVIGPAQDGGYYLLGMRKMFPPLFKNKAWGTPTVLKDTLTDLDTKNTYLLPEKNDVDYYEDIAGIPVFESIIKTHTEI